MKKINEYITESFKINSKTVQKIKGLNLEEFQEDLEAIFNLNSKEIEHMVYALDTDIDIKKYLYQYVDDVNKEYNDLSIIGADMVNHPSTYRNKKIYTNNIIDLYVYLYTNDEDKKYLYFVDNMNDKFYIYKLNEINR